MDDAVLRESIRRELGRGGQIFYVYNRVEGIYERAAKGAELGSPRRASPWGTVRLGEAALEQTMFDFIEGRYDILVSTAIIESGLDIPRANTIIIDRADMFGLSQLYQLSGRVGRSKDRGYCYLIVPPPSTMTDEARARIEALEQHTDLGSGFQIASLDLELRGAGGDLLSGEQSGNVASVGFDLYCQMLQEAVHELRGEPIVTKWSPRLSSTSRPSCRSNTSPTSACGSACTSGSPARKGSKRSPISPRRWKIRFGPPSGEACQLCTSCASRP